MPLIDLANPTRFLAFCARALPWFAAATLVAVATGVNLALNAPDDDQQGAAVKIMFIHVPAAWLAMGCWTIMTVAALGTRAWRHRLA
jgi:heme exporter protein C